VFHLEVFGVEKSIGTVPTRENGRFFQVQAFLDTIWEVLLFVMFL
jgi:hypothetical protein